jgi:hypothetical protein
VRLEGLGQLKKFSDLIGTRTRDLPVCSIVSQPTTLRRAPVKRVERLLLLLLLVVVVVVVVAAAIVEVGENCIMTSFITCTLRQVQLYY